MLDEIFRSLNRHDNRNPETTAVAHGLPLVGVLPELALDPIRLFKRAAEDHRYEVVQLDLGLTEAYLVTHPEHVKYVLQDNARNFGKGPAFRRMRRVMGKGLGTAEGELWRRNRRLMQPTFSSHSIEAMTRLMIDGVGDYIEDRLSRVRPGSSVEMLSEMMGLTQKVVLNTLFSTSISARRSDVLVNAISTALQHMNLRMLAFFLPEGTPLPGDRSLVNAIRTIDEFVRGIVRERQDGGKEYHDLLSVLMAARDENGEGGMSAAQIRDEVVTMYLAGTETTAAALTWMWYLLDAHPDVDRRFRAEIDGALKGRTPAASDLGSMPYGKQVLLEVMRLYPPIWFIPRVAHEDDEIGGRDIPGGSVVLLSPYMTHRHPSFWSDPEVFDPGRFASDEVSRPRFAYYPFGGGPRQCIGNHFALVEAQLAATMVAQRYHPRLVRGHHVELRSTVSLRPRHGLRMTLDPAGTIG